MKSQKLLFWLTTILIPVILVLGAVRILLTPVFIQVEYRLPNFPEDPYGFSQRERLELADIARKYLVNREGIGFLGDLTFETGEGLYNERELRHMLDVKNVVRIAMIVLYSSLVIVCVIGYSSRRKGDWMLFTQSISMGGWLTVGLFAAVIVFIFLNFNTLFVGFHRIFFEGETWIFKYSDTLIRLFPVKFWQDAFISVSLFSILGGLLLGRYFPSIKFSRK